MTSRRISDSFHLVISTRELQSVEELEDFLVKNRSVNDYIISVEYGQNGHPHIDAYVQLGKEYRQDKFREVLIKALYTHVPKEERINIKVIVNTLDSDPRYAIGYALKESPTTIKTTYSNDYMQESLQYYFDNVQQINKQKEIIQAKYKDKPITIDSLGYDFLKYCKSFQITQEDGTKYNSCMSDYESNAFFKEFLKTYNRVLPLSLLQKLKKETLYEYVKYYVDEDFV